jgi:excisionase family DNA binding protein
MSEIQFIQVTPNDLVNRISESVKTQIQELSNYLKALTPTKNEKEFLTRKEVAELFKVSLVTIHEWCNSGVLKHYKVGNRTYFKYSELLETLYNSNRS